jgi:hypothetical protein
MSVYSDITANHSEVDMKLLHTTALLSTLLLGVAADASAQSERVMRDGDCTVFRTYQRDGSYAQERRCITRGYGEQYARNQQDIFRDLRRNERQFERGRITYNDYRREQRRLNIDLARMDRERSGPERSAGGVAAYATDPRPRVERQGNRETYWSGNCQVTRLYSGDGSYSESRSCR